MSTPTATTPQGETVSVSPSTGEPLGRTPVDSEQHVRDVLRRSHAAQPGWAAAPLRQRVGHILRVRDDLVTEIDEIADLISRCVGKTRLEALTTEIMPAVTGSTYYAKQARRFLKPRRISKGSPLSFNKLSRLYRVPFGVVGIIGPWNYPLGIPFHEIVPALLAGNTVVFKTAPETVLVGKKIEELFRRAELPTGVFEHVNMRGSKLGGILLAEGGVDRLCFTGSVRAGKILMAQAAETLTPISLELGGNDAMLVCEDADLERAVNGTVWAGFQNCGQSCGAIERIYVHRSVYEPFLALLKQRVDGLRVGPDAEHDVDVGAICTARQVATVREHIDDALARGAVIHAQSRAPEGAHFVPPTVLTQVSHEMQVMREETFGPVVGVMPVDSMDRAVELANDSDLGLTGSVWSRNGSRAAELGRRIQAGAITINDHLVSHGLAETPWGGFKESGIGRTHGKIGFDEMTEPQVVVRDFLPLARRNLFWHPYGRDVYAGIRGAVEAFYGRGLLRRVGGWAKLARMLPRMFRR